MEATVRLQLVVIVVLGALNLCAAENLVPGGDFTEAKKGKIDWCRREGGAFSLFNEEYTWNNCGKLEIRETYTNGNVHTRSASVSITCAPLVMAETSMPRIFSLRVAKQSISRTIIFCETSTSRRVR